MSLQRSPLAIEGKAGSHAVLMVSVKVTIS